jgi:ectoine hydroxylase-related dioxygenase (phytanoyl-CoA dioxygenase family)
MPAGSAVIYTGGVIHGGGAYITDQPRRAVHFSYRLGWLRTEENNHLSIPPAIAAALPRQAQEVLGYSVYDARVGESTACHLHDAIPWGMRSSEAISSSSASAHWPVAIRMPA